jgi:hypothetical protein
MFDIHVPELSAHETLGPPSLLGRHRHHADAAPWDGSGTAPAILLDILRAKTVITNLKLGYKLDTLLMTDDDRWATFMSDRRSPTWPGTSPPRVCRQRLDRYGHPDPHRHRHRPHQDQARGRRRAHRDHPGRPDRLRARRLRAGQNGHRHPDPDCHEPGAQGDHSRQPALSHRDHPGAAPTGLASHSFRPCCR